MRGAFLLRPRRVGNGDPGNAGAAERRPDALAMVAWDAVPPECTAGAELASRRGQYPQATQGLRFPH